jgi:ribosomal protein S18 acetylase RimI-like enzyme
VWKLNLLVRAENEAVRGFYEALGLRGGAAAVHGAEVDL